MNKSVENIVSEILLDLIKNKINIVIDSSKELKLTDKIICEGYFDDENFVCAVGKNYKEWIFTFVHEYCHFLQKKEQCKEWKKYNNNKTISQIDDWIEGSVNLSKSRVHSAIKIIKELELDCEKRVVNYLNEKEFYFDEGLYIRRSNAYIYFYDMVEKYRTWYNEHPTTNLDILNIMPDYWLDNYDETPPKYEKLFLEKCR